MWTLKLGAAELRCALSTHPLGWELRVNVREYVRALSGLQDTDGSLRHVGRLESRGER
jgi:hypothetical protein